MPYPSRARRQLADEYGPRLRLLAEKVETHEDVQEAMSLGYSYFQGYFYCKPQVITTRQIPASKQNHVRFLQEINRPDADFDRIEALIRQDMSLSVKLLRYLNSAMFSLRNEITSIRHAMSMLGLQPLRKWASLVAAMAIAEPGGAALVLTCLVRARFCELAGAAAQRRATEMDLYLTGLLSGLDAMLDCPMPDLLRQMAIPSAVRDALLGRRTPLRDVLDLIIACERADRARVFSQAATLGLTPPQISRAYQEAMAWADWVTGV